MKGYPKPYCVNGEWYQPIPDARGFRQRGLASWYGKDFHGKKTSNGEIYNMYARTAAHKTLPLGTLVSVRNLENGKSVEARVNDRGPFVRGRIIDLSYTLAGELGVVGPGTAPVEVVALAAPVGSHDPNVYYTGNFTIQVGAFRQRDNAERLRDKLGERYRNAHVVSAEVGGEMYYRVRVGKCSSLAEAARHEKALGGAGYPEAFIVAE
jgi:rare lipoprotein A